jgi:hypothetical protein
VALAQVRGQGRRPLHARRPRCRRAASSSGVVERRDLEKVAKTYGKIIHFWQVDRGDVVPLGLPQIMMALTREGQLQQDFAECKLAHQGGPDGARQQPGDKLALRIKV